MKFRFVGLIFAVLAACSLTEPVQAQTTSGQISGRVVDLDDKQIETLLNMDAIAEVKILQNNFEGARGFVGLAFRLQNDMKAYDAF